MTESEAISSQPLLGGIEAGGTKIVCAVGVRPEEPFQEERFPTGAPEATMEAVAGFFHEAIGKHGPLRAVGIGTFGPANIQPRSPGYGEILTTPKAGWEGFNMVEFLRAALDAPVPVAFETDVNAAAIGEAVFGAGKAHRHVCYVTVGTGIGGGFLHDGEPLHGRMHPEVGHMVMPDLDGEFGKATNVCPFHASCWEGRASGPALEARWGSPGAELPEDHVAWDLQGRYLAQGVMNLTAAYSPDIIILGGGVMRQAGLIDRARAAFDSLAGGYWDLPPLDVYLQTPALDQKAGIVGALALAQRLLQMDPAQR